MGKAQIWGRMDLPEVHSKVLINVIDAKQRAATMAALLYALFNSGLNVICLRSHTEL